MPNYSPCAGSGACAQGRFPHLCDCKDTPSDTVAPVTFADEELTVIYNESNGLDPKSFQPITTQRIFTAMRAMASRTQSSLLRTYLLRLGAWVSTTTR